MNPCSFLKSFATSILVVTALLSVNNAKAQIDLIEVGVTQPGFRVDGIPSGDWAISSVSGAGDVNGDGLADLIIGAPNADPGGADDAGAAYVVFGKTDQGSVELENLTGGGFVIEGAEADDFTGSSVSGAGDVNGDGFGDLVIGAPSPVNALVPGKAYVVFGKDNGTTVSLSSLGSSGFGIVADDGSTRFGQSVAGAGDVNGDGLDDIIIGEPDASPNSRNRAGRVWVVYGQAGSADIALSDLTSGASGIVMNGEFADTLSGETVCGAGDVNADGYADLLVGTRVTANWGCLAYVVFGDDSLGSVELSVISAGMGGFRIETPDAGLGFIVSTFPDFEWTVSSAGDVNADGLSDLLIGQPEVSPTYISDTVFGDKPDAGVTYLVFGKNDTISVPVDDLATPGAGFRLHGVADDDNSGYSVSGIGDLNGDGYTDLLIGAPNADPGGPGNTLEGECYVVFGKPDSTTIELDDLKNTNAGYRVEGVNPGDFAGSSVSGAGDVNGDGLSDFILEGSDLAAYVVFGPGPGITPGITPGTVNGYSSVIIAGDAPPTIVGRGNGTNGNPSRTIVDFDDGTGPSIVEAQVTTGPFAAPPFNIDDIAHVHWELTTDRVFSSPVTVMFKYTDAEIVGLVENDLSIYKADNLSGPWTKLNTTLDPDLNQVSAKVTSFSYFIISDLAGVPTGLEEYFWD